MTRLETRQKSDPSSDSPMLLSYEMFKQLQYGGKDISPIEEHFFSMQALAPTCQLESF